MKNNRSHTPKHPPKLIYRELRIHTTEREILVTAIIKQPLRSMQEEKKEDHQSSVILPSNLTEEERIAWFRKKAPPGFEILKSKNMTKEFHGRVLEFFNNECAVQILMTWISPVALDLECVFKVHPHGCLLILSRDMDFIQGYKILKPLLDPKHRVAAITPDLSFMFKKTPAETWFEEMVNLGEIPFSESIKPH